MKQLAAKDNPAFAHMTTTAADAWAVMSILKLARSFGIRFIFAVLVQYLFQDIDSSIERLEAASAEQSSLIKKLGKIISIELKLKTIFSGVRIRDMKTIPKYDKSEAGDVVAWVMANQADLMRIDWTEFEKRVKAGSVGHDCPVKFDLKPSVSVNYDDLLKFHGPPSKRMAIQIADELDEPDMGLSETAIVYPDTNPEPAPIQVKPSLSSSVEQDLEKLASIVKQSGVRIGEAQPDPPPVSLEAAPQASPGVEVTDEQLQSMIDKSTKLIKSDDKFPDDIPF